MNPRPELDAARYLTETLGPEVAAATTAIVAGSGLSGLADLGRCVAEAPFDAIPGMGASTIAGHAGCWRLIQPEAGPPFHLMLGRRHLYEGIEPELALHGVRTAAALGVKRLILTNAAGGLSPHLGVGDLMRLTDHLNLQFIAPLRGAHLVARGPRFVDLSRPYDEGLAGLLHEGALELGFVLKEGVYAAMAGPTFETRAEVAMLRRMGAHAVGMSTVPEVLAARQAGMRVVAISLITNSHLAGEAASHEEVLREGRLAAGRLVKLLGWLLTRDD